MAGGICCGLAALVTNFSFPGLILSFYFLFFPKQGAGIAIGIVGEAGVKANAQQERLFVGMILMLIFAEAIALFGLIVALVISK